MMGWDDLLLAGIITAGAAGASAWSNRQAQKQGFAMNKESWEYYQKQRELDYKYDSGKYLDLDKQYNEWYKQLEYDWKKRYSENSAKWTVDGLKNAGLNPLLAASSGFTGSQMSSGPVTASRSSSGSALGHSAEMHGNNDIGGTLSNLAGSVATGSLIGPNREKAEAEAEVAEETVPTQINSAKVQNVLAAEKINTEKALQAKYAQDSIESASRTVHQNLENDKLSASGGYKHWLVHDVNILGNAFGESAKAVYKGASKYLESSAKGSTDFARKVVDGVKPVSEAVKSGAKKAAGAVGDAVKSGVRRFGEHVGSRGGILQLR